jgi:hypothetical protein
MRRRLLWLVAVAGLAWLYLRRGARRPQPVDSVPAPADPAGELRRKLDATKERVEDDAASHLATPEPAPVEPPHADPAEPVEPSAPAVSEDLDARRREVHERARAAADEMRGTSSD